MALEKEYELNTGVSGRYWVMSFSVNGISKEVKVKMSLFKDKSVRDGGKLSMHVLEFIYMLSELPSMANPATTLGQASAICYAKVKQESAFRGSSDV